MKHAYLILAHNEFEILQKLVTAIDDKRNDIFIHFDAKVKNLPKIEISFSNLYVLSNRINVCWGDVSVVEAELELFKIAMQTGDYDYFHLLSGVDMPLKTQDYIHNFFEENKGKEFIGYSTYNTSSEIERKVNKWHLFSKKFKSKNVLIKILRAAFLKAQYLVGYKRNNKIEFKKGTQWVSVTNNLVKIILQQEQEIKKIYTHTFCPDEIFIQTICWNSNLKKNIYDLKNEGKGCLRAINWVDNVILEWQEEDVDGLLNGELILARKFSSEQLKLVNLILGKLNNKNEQ